jgi:biotin carboxyl carrier protein
VTFDLEVGGRTRTVAIETGEAPGRFRVTLDGVPREIDAVSADAHTWSIILDGDRASETVAVRERVPGEFVVHLRGGTIEVAVGGRRGRRSGAATGHAGSGQRVSAPMPGRVLRVLVQPGDAVRARQPLVVVEAMKMENELRAIADGIVREVAVAPGTSVEAGRLLVVIG